MAKTIKLWDSIAVTVNGSTEKYENPRDLWAALNMDNEEVYKEAQENIIRALYCFGRIDLSDAYPGYTVQLAVVPCKKEEAAC